MFIQMSLFLEPDHRAGRCSPDPGGPAGSGAGLQQDPGSRASSLSVEMRNEKGPGRDQTHEPTL